MLRLALDTSTRYSSIALCSDSEFYGEYTWYSGNNHSIELLEYVQRLCAQAQISLQELELIAVAIGPGSFTGVRVALATAKTLAFALRKPLAGVSTLDILAFQQHRYGVQRPVCALLEAGRSEVYAATYMFDELVAADGELSYRLRRLSDYLLVTPQQLVVYLREQMPNWFPSVGSAQGVSPTDHGSAQGVSPTDHPTLAQGAGQGMTMWEFPAIVFCGEISVNTQQALYTAFPQSSLFVRGAQAARRAASLAAIALQQVNEGHADDPLTLEPLYLRRPSITKSTRKQPFLSDKALQHGDQHTREREEGALRH